MAQTALTTYVLTATMESILRGVEKGVLGSKLGAVTSVGISLAAACVAISLIRISSEFLKGKVFDWWQFVRPLLIFFIVCNFSTLALAPVRAISGVYNTQLTAAVGSGVDEFKAIFKEKAEQMCHEQFGSDSESWAVDETADNGVVRFLKKLGNKITAAFFNLNEAINFGAAQICAGVMFFFLDIFTSVMIIIANLYLIIMALIGPFTFALSILPSFKNGIKLWVERYIQYTLWQPLLYIIMYLGTEILVQGNQSATMGGFWTWFFMCIAIFTMIKQVPGIASFIIESAGTESLANQMSGLGGSLVQKAGSAAMMVK